MEQAASIENPPAESLPVEGPPERRPRRGDVLELEIARLDDAGHGVAALERCGLRYRAAVRGALPGERLRAEVAGYRRQRLSCRGLELLRESASRIEPRCRHMAVPGRPGRGCGGCGLQMLAYEDQLRFKEGRVRDHLRTAGLGHVLVRPILGMERPWLYRNKMELSFGYDEAGRLALGLHPPERRYDVLRLEECFLQSDAMCLLAGAALDWAEAHSLRPHSRLGDGGWLCSLAIREGKRTGQRMMELVTTGDEVAAVAGAGARDAATLASDLCERLTATALRHGQELTSFYWTRKVAMAGRRTRLAEQVLHGSPVLVEELHLPGRRPLRFDVHPRSFFQPSTLQAEVLYHQVALAAGLDGGRRRHVLDLYCGTGTIGLCLADGAGHVTGIELVPDAVENARRSAWQNGIANAEFRAGDVVKVMAELGLHEGDPDLLVVVDPPRAGLSKAACEHVAATRAGRIVYVSCNPEALARDIAVLRGAGYATRLVQPVDMFPHTAHVESVALLEKEP